MTLDEYQIRALGHARYPKKKITGGVVYTVLALCGEAGELANKLKKLLREDRLPETQEEKAVLMDELSDVLWYVSSTATELGYTLNEVAKFNLEKLEARRRKD